MHIYLTAVGDFGGAVAERLAAEHSVDVAAPYEAPDTSRWRDGALHVVATWRETPALFELADRQAHILGRPWLPVTLDGTSLRVGPLVPGRNGPCYRCFLARQFQHRRLRDTDRRLFGLYDEDPTCGVSGYLAPHVELAAVAVGIAVAAIESGEGTGEHGRFRRFGLLEPSVTVADVIPVHGCTRCDSVDPDATWAELARDVGGITSGPAPQLLESVPEPAHASAVTR